MSGLVAEILYTDEQQAHLLHLDMERTGEDVIRWLERRGRKLLAIPARRRKQDKVR